MKKIVEEREKKIMHESNNLNQVLNPKKKIVFIMPLASF